MVLIITLSIVAPLAFFAYPKKAEAVCTPFIASPINLDPISVPTNPSQTSPWNIADAFQNGNEWFKTCVLDGLAIAVAKQIIKQLTMSIVTWINSGFKGNPAFVQNPGQFFGAVADRVAGSVIENIAPFLCSPFKLNIQLALALNYGSGIEEEIGCTLTDVENNFRNFTEGTGGGWDNWFQITQNPNNNPHGALLNAEAILSASIQTSQGTYQRELSWGDGFLSFRNCEADRQISGTADEVPIPSDGSAIAINQPIRQSNQNNFAANTSNTTNNSYQNNFAAVGSIFGNNSLLAQAQTQNTGSVRTGGSSISPTYNRDATGQGNHLNANDSSDVKVYGPDNKVVYGTTIDPNNPNCSIQTPGAAIQSQLGNTLNSDLRGLEIAQSIDQIVAALVGQLVSQALGGLGGLAGASKNSSSGSSFNYQNLLDQSGVPSQIPNLPITGSCIPNKQTAQIGEAVEWEAYVPDINGQVSYVWQSLDNDDESISGFTSKITKVYGASGIKNAKVIVTTTDGQSAELICSPGVSIVDGAVNNTTVSCAPTPAIAQRNQPVTWQVSTNNSSAISFYAWDGDDGLTGSTASVVKTYDTAGIKRAGFTTVVNSVISDVRCSDLTVNP